MMLLDDILFSRRFIMHQDEGGDGGVGMAGGSYGGEGGGNGGGAVGGGESGGETGGYDWGAAQGQEGEGIPGWIGEGTEEGGTKEGEGVGEGTPTGGETGGYDWGAAQGQEDEGIPGWVGEGGKDAIEKGGDTAPGYASGMAEERQAEQIKETARQETIKQIQEQEKLAKATTTPTKSPYSKVETPAEVLSSKKTEPEGVKPVPVEEEEGKGKPISSQDLKTPPAWDAKLTALAAKRDAGLLTLEDIKGLTADEYNKLDVINDAGISRDWARSQLGLPNVPFPNYMAGNKTLSAEGAALLMPEGFYPNKDDAKEKLNTLTEKYKLNKFDVSGKPIPQLAYTREELMSRMFEENPWLTPYQLQLAEGVFPISFERMYKLTLEDKKYKPSAFDIKVLKERGVDLDRIDAISREIGDTINGNQNVGYDPQFIFGLVGDIVNYDKYDIPRDVEFARFAETLRYMLGTEGILTDAQKRDMIVRFAERLSSTKDESGATQSFIISPMLRGVESNFGKFAYDSGQTLRPANELDEKGDWIGERFTGKTDAEAKTPYFISSMVTKQQSPVVIVNSVSSLDFNPNKNTIQMIWDAMKGDWVWFLPKDVHAANEGEGYAITELQREIYPGNVVNVQRISWQAKDFQGKYHTFYVEVDAKTHEPIAYMRDGDLTVSTPMNPISKNDPVKCNSSEYCTFSEGQLKSAFSKADVLLSGKFEVKPAEPKPEAVIPAQPEAQPPVEPPKPPQEPLPKLQTIKRGADEFVVLPDGVELPKERYDSITDFDLKKELTLKGYDAYVQKMNELYTVISGLFVKKSTYEDIGKFDPDLKKALDEGGEKAYKQKIDEKYVVIEGKLMDKSAYNNLPPDMKVALDRGGWAGYERYINDAYVKGGDNKLVPKGDYYNFTDIQKEVFKSQGYDKLTQWNEGMWALLTPFRKPEPVTGKITEDVDILEALRSENSDVIMAVHTIFPKDVIEQQTHDEYGHPKLISTKSWYDLYPADVDVSPVISRAGIGMEVKLTEGSEPGFAQQLQVISERIGNPIYWKKLSDWIKKNQPPEMKEKIVEENKLVKSVSDWLPDIVSLFDTEGMIKDPVNYTIQNFEKKVDYYRALAETTGDKRYSAQADYYEQLIAIEKNPEMQKLAKMSPAETAKALVESIGTVRVEAQKELEKLPELAKPIPFGVLALGDLLLTVPATMASGAVTFAESGVKAAIGKKEERETKAIEAALVPVVLGAGMAGWFLDRPHAVLTRPAEEITYTAAMLAGVGKSVGFIRTPFDAIKSSIKGEYVSRALSHEAGIALGRYDTSKMSFESSRRVIEGVENLLQQRNQGEPILSRMFMRDVTYSDPISGASLRVSPVNKIRSGDVYSATSEGEVWRQQINNAARKSENIKIEGRTEGAPIDALWFSQLPAWQFMERGKGKNPTVLAIITDTKRDYVNLIDEVPEAQNALEWGDLARAEQIIRDKASRGELSEKAMNIWKVQFRSKLPELEGTYFTGYDNLVPVPKELIPKHMQKEGWDTAVMSVDSPVTIEGLVEQGKPVDVVYLMTRNAIDAGLKPPSRAEITAANVVSIFSDMRKMFAGNPRRVAEETERIYTSDPRIMETLKIFEGRPSYLDTYEKADGTIGYIRPASPRTGVRGVKEEMGGMTREGVELIMVNDKGEVVVGNSLVEPEKFASNIGGAIDTFAYGDTFKQNVIASAKTEAGVDLRPEDVQYVGIYEGLRKNHTYSGSRVYIANIGKQVPNPIKGTDPSLPPEMRWTGLIKKDKVEITDRQGNTTEVKLNELSMYPAFIDTIKGAIDVYKRQYPDKIAPDIDFTSLREAKPVKNVQGGNIKDLLKNRDKSFSERVHEGTMITEAQLRDFAMLREQVRLALTKLPVPPQTSVAVMDLVTDIWLKSTDKNPSSIAYKVAYAIANKLAGQKGAEIALVDQIKKASTEVKSGEIKLPDSEYVQVFKSPLTEKVKAEAFLTEAGKNPRAEYMKNYSKPEYKGELDQITFYMSKDGKSGYGLKSDGEIVNLFNNGAKGQGALMMVDAILRGGTKENHYMWTNREGLRYYEQFGFVPVREIKGRNGRTIIWSEYKLADRDLQTLIDYATEYLGGRPVWADKVLKEYRVKEKFVEPSISKSIGRYGLYGKFDKVAELNAIKEVAGSGEKDIASVHGEELANIAKDKGLIVEEHPFSDAEYKDMGQKLYYVRRNTLEALAKLERLKKLEEEITFIAGYEEGKLQLHREIGELYGYSKADIDAYIKSAKLSVEPQVTPEVKGVDVVSKAEVSEISKAVDSAITEAKEYDGFAQKWSDEFQQYRLGARGAGEKSSATVRGELYNFYDIASGYTKNEKLVELLRDGRIPEIDFKDTITSISKDWELYKPTEADLGAWEREYKRVVDWNREDKRLSRLDESIQNYLNDVVNPLMSYDSPVNTLPREIQRIAYPNSEMWKLAEDALLGKLDDRAYTAFVKRAYDYLYNPEVPVEGVKPKVMSPDALKSYLTVYNRYRDLVQDAEAGQRWNEAISAWRDYNKARTSEELGKLQKKLDAIDTLKLNTDIVTKSTAYRRLYDDIGYRRPEEVPRLPVRLRAISDEVYDRTVPTEMYPVLRFEEIIEPRGTRRAVASKRGRVEPRYAQEEAMGLYTVPYQKPYEKPYTKPYAQPYTTTGYTPPYEPPPPTYLSGRKPIGVKLAVEKYKALSKQQKLASIAWRQGLFYVLWHPTWQQDDVIFSQVPIPDVKYFKGYRSAYKSAVRVRGEFLPKQVTRRMGFIQVGAEKAGEKPEPVLTFEVLPEYSRKSKRIKHKNGNGKKQVETQERISMLV